jgi:hypothetical protein
MIREIFTICPLGIGSGTWFPDNEAGTIGVDISNSKPMQWKRWNVPF